MGQATSPRAPRPRVVSSAECEHVEVQRAECMIGIWRSHRLLHLLTYFVPNMGSFTPTNHIAVAAASQKWWPGRLPEFEVCASIRSTTCSKTFLLDRIACWSRSPLFDQNSRPSTTRSLFFSRTGDITMCRVGECGESGGAGSRLSGSPVKCIGETGHMIFHFNFLNRKNRDHLLCLCSEFFINSVIPN